MTRTVYLSTGMLAVPFSLSWAWEGPLGHIERGLEVCGHSAPDIIKCCLHGTPHTHPCGPHGSALREHQVREHQVCDLQTRCSGPTHDPFLTWAEHLSTRERVLDVGTPREPGRRLAQGASPQLPLMQDVGGTWAERGPTNNGMKQPDPLCGFKTLDLGVQPPAR